MSIQTRCCKGPLYLESIPIIHISWYRNSQKRSYIIMSLSSGKPPDTQGYSQDFEMGGGSHWVDEASAEGAKNF